MVCPYHDKKCGEHAHCYRCQNDICEYCRFNFYDRDVELYECLKAEELTDAEYEEYCERGFVSHCSCFAPNNMELFDEWLQSMREEFETE